MMPATVIAAHYLTFEQALPSSILRIVRWGVDMLCTVVARSPGPLGTGSVTVDVILSSGRYERFTLMRYSDVSWSLPGELSARLVLQ